jgi:N-acetylglucosaminyl-diphospho-decaprenol L-rhamnosyltransferase
MTKSVHIVIVNWNTGDELRVCLASIAATAPHGPLVERVTIVDNASSDGSADRLDDVPLPLGVVRNSWNAGFAAACNQGAADSTADYLLFLNPDTRLPPNTLGTVMAFMESEHAATVGICGVQILESDGRPGLACARFPTLRVLFGKMVGLDHLLPQLFPSHHLTSAELRHSQPVDQVIGAFYFVRRELFTELGGFDERYFIYFEEVDFSLRARHAGRSTYFLKDAVAYHVGNVSSDQVPDIRLYHSLRSRILFAYKHWPRLHASLLVALTLTVELLARLARAAWRRSVSEILTTLSAYGMLVRDLLGRGHHPLKTQD